MRERDRWESEWVRERETVKERERERKGGVREREKDEESMRIGKERKSPGKTDVSKLYAYNECEHYVPCVQKNEINKQLFIGFF